MRRFFFILSLFFLGNGAVYAETGSQAFDIRLGDNSARFMYATEVFGGSLGPKFFSKSKQSCKPSGSAACG